ncbi:MAG TPA: PAS domain S-box protein [Anaerolineales bacterium]|nr:PAS domain S-box protein [Anaerolineales bacterium]
MDNLHQQPPTEEILKKSEARFRNLLEFAPDALVISDQNGRIVMVNAKTEAMFGYAREALIGAPIEMLIPEQFRAVHVHHRERYAKAPNIRPMGIGYELLGLKKDGEAFLVEISLSPLEEDDGVLITSMIRDISERKRVEQELDAMVEFARLNPSPVIRLDASGVVVLANPAARTYFQMDDLVGKRWEDVCPNVDPIRLGKLFDSSGSFYQELALTGRSLSLLYNRVSETSFVHVFGFDITTQKNVEKELQALTEALEKRVHERTRALQDSMDRLERIFGETIYAMAKVVETRDIYTSGHQERDSGNLRYDGFAQMFFRLIIIQEIVFLPYLIQINVVLQILPHNLPIRKRERVGNHPRPRAQFFGKFFCEPLIGRSQQVTNHDIGPA